MEDLKLPNVNSLPSCDTPEIRLTLEADLTSPTQAVADQPMTDSNESRTCLSETLIQNGSKEAKDQKVTNHDITTCQPSQNGFSETGVRHQANQDAAVGLIRSCKGEQQSFEKALDEPKNCESRKTNEQKSDDADSCRTDEPASEPEVGNGLEAAGVVVSFCPNGEEPEPPAPASLTSSHCRCRRLKNANNNNDDDNKDEDDDFDAMTSSSIRMNDSFSSSFSFQGEYQDDDPVFFSTSYCASPSFDNRSFDKLYFAKYFSFNRFRL